MPARANHGHPKSRQIPKYRQIFDRLARDIASGKYAVGQKFPSEATLVRQFGASRITVGRAVRDLKDQGLVQRIAGSGTYVRDRSAKDSTVLFGLIWSDPVNLPICGFGRRCFCVFSRTKPAAVGAVLSDD